MELRSCFTKACSLREQNDDRRPFYVVVLTEKGCRTISYLDTSLRANYKKSECKRRRIRRRAHRNHQASFGPSSGMVGAGDGATGRSPRRALRLQKFETSKL